MERKRNLTDFFGPPTKHLKQGCLRRIKTWLRGRMTNDRLDHLAILNIEKAIYMSCTDEEITTEFNNMKTRR